MTQVPASHRTQFLDWRSVVDDRFSLLVWGVKVVIRFVFLSVWGWHHTAADVAVVCDPSVRLKSGCQLRALVDHT